MATIKFLLNRPKNSDGSLKAVEVAIMVEIYVSLHKRPQLSTCEKILPKHWNAKTQSAKGTLVNHSALNLRLLEIRKDLAELWVSNRDADKFELKRLAQEYLKGKDYNVRVEKKNNPFSDFVNRFVDNCEGKNGPENKIERGKSTIAYYKNLLSQIEAYAASKKVNLSFESITLEFYNGFTAYLWDTLKHNDNTVGKAIKTLKMFMNQAFDEDLHTNLAYKKSKFKKLTSDTDEVYLSADEILKIYSLDLKDSPRMADVRDLFCFGCWVGLRFGDLCNIRPEQVQQLAEGKVIKVHTEKTGQDVVIPFHPLCEAIYSIHNNRLPDIKKSDSAQFNADLKEIVKRAGIKTKHQSRRVVRGKAKFVYLEKWEMVSAHTARRSFASNCYLMGVPIISIMAITGHTTEKAFMKYIRVTKNEHAQIMLNHFNSAPVLLMRKAQ